MAFVPNAAPLVVIAFLLTGLAVSAASLVVLHALVTGHRQRAWRVFLFTAAWIGAYAVVLSGASLLSEERVLAQGEQKYFCEVDCHLAYSVESVTTTPILGAGEQQARARGMFYVVTLKTWFDERTISSRRPKDLPLFPNLRWAVVLDGQGRRHATSLAGMQALELPAGGNVPLTQSLRPGEAYQTVLVFDLPPDAANARLLLTDPLPLNWLLIGHENSFFHKKVFFALGPPHDAKARARSNFFILKN